MLWILRSDFYKTFECFFNKCHVHIDTNLELFLKLDARGFKSMTTSISTRAQISYRTQNNH